MVVKRGYKQTEVGVIPEDWGSTRLGQSLSVIDGDRGLNYPSTGDLMDSGECLFLNAGNVTRHGFRFSDTTFISKQKDIDLNKGKLRRDDIVLTTRGTVGNFAHFDISVPYEHVRINSGMVILRNESTELDTAFLFFLLRSPMVQEQLERLSFGSAQPQLTVSGIKGFVLIFPPKREQRAIAAALSDVDALIASLDRLIAKKRDLKQAAMQQLLTGQTRLPGFGGKWKITHVHELGDVLAGKALAVHAPGKLRPYLRTKNVLEGQIDLEDVLEMPFTEAEFERFRLRNGDILLNEGQSLELVGRCSMYRNEMAVPCAMQNQLLRFRAGVGVCPDFAEHKFRRCQLDGTFASIATQTTSVAHLGSSRFSKLRLLWPKDFAEQSAIASVLSDMDAELTALKQRRDKTKLLKHGVMQELLTGKTRLI